MCATTATTDSSFWRFQRILPPAASGGGGAARFAPGARATADAAAIYAPIDPTLVGRLTMSFTIPQPQAVSGLRSVLVLSCALKGG